MRHFNLLQHIDDDDLMDKFLSSRRVGYSDFPYPFNFGGNLMSFEKQTGLPSAFDVSYDEKHCFVSIDMPGVDKKDISLELKGNEMTVSGERKSKNAKSQEIARFQGKVSNTIKLGKGLDLDNITASLSNGVLTVKIAKKAVENKKIEIK